MFYYQDECSRPARLVVLPAAVPGWPSVGAGPGHRRLDSVRLPQCTGQRGSRPSVGALPEPGMPVDLVPATARGNAGRLPVTMTQGKTVPPSAGLVEGCHGIGGAGCRRAQLRRLQYLEVGAELHEVRECLAG
jgi:hypothetical protein